MHQQRKTRAAYRKHRLRIVRTATECTWCHVAISDRLPRNHPQKATADHLEPLSRGGRDTLDNLVPACFLCNSQRGNMTPGEFLAYLRRSGRLHSAPGATGQTSRDW